MARKPRVHLPGGYYHVMMRGNVGSDIFFSPADRTRFMLLMQEGVERYGHRIHAFCLMSNHVHLLIQVGTTPLANIIQNLGFRYTRYVNRQRGEVGHLFQGRYKAILVDADSYLLELARYIHLNPVRAGICKRAEDFEWSSQQAYMGIVTIPWLHTETILARFSPDESKARPLMLDYIEQGMGEARRAEFHQGSHLGQILGDDNFAERAIHVSGQFDRVKPPAIAQIIQAVCREYGIDQSVLYEAGKGRKSSEARAMAALVIQQTEGVTLTALAKELGRELSSLSQSAGRLRKQMVAEKSLQERFESISNAITIPNCQA